MEKRIKVINILSHPPTYALYEGEQKPEINWDTPDGSWVGIWGNDWPDQLGNEVLKISDEFEYEVWQPDLRADKIYEHNFENGLVHKLFPSKEYCYPFSFGIYKDVISIKMISLLKEYANQYNIIIQLNNLRGAISYKCYETFMKINVPIMVTGHGSILTPSDQSRSMTKNPLMKMALFFEEKRLQKLQKRINYISDENNFIIKYLSKRLKRNVGYLIMGCDFSYWSPKGPDFVMHPLIAERKERGQLCFLSVANYIPRKRLDLMINLFNSLNKYNNFCLILVGHGEDEYTKYLKKIGMALEKEHKLCFVEYTRGDKLKQIYQSADFFISLSKSEGTQVASEHAAGVGIPIIAMKNNGIADALKDTNTGLRLNNDDINEWRLKIEKLLNGKQILPIPLSYAKSLYDWENVTRKYIAVYQDLIHNSYGKNI